MNVKEKFLEIKDKTVAKTKKAVQWCKDNPDLALGIGTVVLAGGKYLGKAAIKHHQVKEQEDVKNLYCYDRSLGHYWKLRRELRNDEWLEVDRRKREGEPLSYILASMRVLD